MEDLVYNDISFQAPTDLDLETLVELISPETWNNYLDDEDRAKLMSLLPEFPENNLEEQTHTLEMFFMDINFRFGTPLRQFHALLTSGYFNPAVTKYRKNKEKVDRKIARYQYCNYLHSTLEETIMRRQTYLDLVSKLPPDSSLHALPLGIKPSSQMCPCVTTRHHSYRRETVDNRARKRFARELHAIKVEAGATNKFSDDEIYSDHSLVQGFSKKHRKQLCAMEASLPPTLVPIKHSQSSGTIARDAVMVYPAHKSLMDLGDVDLNALMSAHSTHSKKNSALLWRELESTKLNEVVERVTEGYSYRRSVSMEERQPVRSRRDRKNKNPPDRQNTTEEKLNIKEEFP